MISAFRQRFRNVQITLVQQKNNEGLDSLLSRTQVAVGFLSHDFTKNAVTKWKSETLATASIGIASSFFDLSRNSITLSEPRGYDQHDARNHRHVDRVAEQNKAHWKELQVDIVCRGSPNSPKHMNKIVPLIGSAEVGPLGVLHLPRLWLKISLDAKQLLADGYPAVGTGFDQMVLDGLGLQKDTVVEYVSNSRPTYCQFESWIKKQPGARLDSASITRLNEAIRGYKHDDGTVQAVLGENGLPADTGIRDAVTLNRIDDWKCFHEAVLK